MTPEMEALVRSATAWAAVPFVPEVTLLTAAEPFGLWDRTERDAPPFWAFPWAGGQGLARYVLDHPETVAGRSVLDVASGSGLVAIAAAKAGARTVTSRRHRRERPGRDRAQRGRQRTPQVAPRSVDLATASLGAGHQDASDLGSGARTARTSSSPPTSSTSATWPPWPSPSSRPRGAPARPSLPPTRPAPSSREPTSPPWQAYQIPVLTVLEDTPVKTVTIYRLS